MDPNNPTPADVDLDMGALSAAIAADAPQIGLPEGAAPAPAPEPPPAETTPAPAAEDKKPAETATPTEKKKGLAALAGEKKPEEKPGEKKADETLPEPEVDITKWKKEQQDAFVAMRQVKKRAEEQAKTALLKAEDLERKLQAATSNPKDRPETVEKLRRLEAWEKAQELQKSDEWKNVVTAPVQRSLATLSKIAERAKVDPGKLEEATDFEDEFDRLDAITALFDSAEAPVPAHLVNAAVQEAAKLHPIYAKAVELKRNAHETLASLSHQTEQQKTAAAAQAKADYTKHHDHVYGQLAEKMSSLFGDPKVGEELTADVKAVRPGTDPADRAYEAQAAAILPTLWERYLAVRDEAAAEKKAKLALLGTRATVAPSTAPLGKPANADDTELDEAGLNEALRGMKGR